MGEPSMGTATPFRGDSAEICFSESPWFSASDIPSESWKGYVVKIEAVLERKGVRFNKGRARARELFLKFVGVDKELRCNITIRRTLDSIIGPSCADWWGKAITLFVQGGIETAEGIKNGVRVRPVLPPQVDGQQRQSKPAAQQPAQNGAATNGAPTAGAAEKAAIIDAATALGALCVKAGIHADAPTPAKAASKHFKEKTQINLGDVVREIDAGTLAKAKAESVLASIRQVAAELDKPRERQPGEDDVL